MCVRLKTVSERQGIMQSSGAVRRITRIRLTSKAVSYLDGYHLKNTAFIQSLEHQLTQEELSKINEALNVLGEILPKLG